MIRPRAVELAMGMLAPRAWLGHRGDSPNQKAKLPRFRGRFAFPFHVSKWRWAFLDASRFELDSRC